MLVIPVLDLSRGLVVHAIKGNRKNYLPIISVISSSSKPEPVLSAFLKLYPFKTIYIADLDAIQGTGDQSFIINQLSLIFNQCEFWVDVGIKNLQNNTSQYKNNNIRLVFGSENKILPKSLAGIFKKKPDTILSLDYCESGLINNSYLLDSTSLWPKQVIIMMLHRVGKNKGIDMGCLKNILNLSLNHDIFVAGGVKNIDDLNQLNEVSVKGALIASALHNGSITGDELNLLAKY